MKDEFKSIESKCAPVDTKNDYQMINEGIRVPKLNIDRSCFEHSLEEKRNLKLLKNKMLSHNNPAQYRDSKEIAGNLVIYYINVDKRNNFKTTENIKNVLRENISNIIAAKKASGLVIKRAFYKNSPINNL